MFCINCNRSLPNPSAEKRPFNVRLACPRAVIYFPISVMSTLPEVRSLPPTNRFNTPIMIHKPRVEKAHKELFDFIDCFNKGLEINIYWASFFKNKVSK